MDERPHELAELKDTLRCVIANLAELGPEGIQVIEEIKQEALKAS